MGVSAKTAEGVAHDIGARLLDIYQRLYQTYGPQHWWPGETPFEVIVGAILTQAAAWRNVEKAIANLKTADALSPEGLHRLPLAELARLIYPAGYYQAKAAKLHAFVDVLHQEFGGDLERLFALPTPPLWARLLAIHGVGPETADSILLYAAGRPVFVIDAYTRRVFSRLGLRPAGDSYEGWQQLFIGHLPSDASLFNEYHALIDHHAKETCRKEPRCGGCSLREGCDFGTLALEACLRTSPPR